MVVIYKGLEPTMLERIPGRLYEMASLSLRPDKTDDQCCPADEMGK